jgi:hypothetical protein
MHAANHKLVLLAAATGYAAVANGAVTTPRERSFDFNHCLAGRTTVVMQLSDNVMAGAFEATAGNYCNTPVGPFDGQGSHCVGTWAITDEIHGQRLLCHGRCRWR